MAKNDCSPREIYGYSYYYYSNLTGNPARVASSVLYST